MISRRFAVRTWGTTFLLVMVCWPQGSFAADALDKQLAELQARAEDAESNRLALEPAVMALRSHTKPILTQVTRLKLEQRQFRESLSETETSLVKLNDALKKLNAEHQKLKSILEMAQQESEQVAGTDKESEAAKKLKGATEKLAASQKGLDDKQLELKKSENRLASLRKDLETATTLLAEREKEFEPLKAELQQLEASYGSSESLAVTARQAHEKVLFDAGRRVSFARHIAPILATKCTACHNPRTAKGRLNLDGFVHILKGGETGKTIVPGQPDDSLLLTLIADGSMPKDADRLSAEQVSLVRRWIMEGAKLDAGLNPQGSLVTLIPKPRQPNPPERYSTNIPVTALAFHPDGQLLATSGYREVLLWSAETGELRRRIKNLAERIHAIRFNAQGTVMYVAAGTPGQLGDVKSFDVATGQLRDDLLTSEDESFSFAVHPQGEKLAIAGADRAIRVLNLVGKKPELVIEDHADWVMHIAWSSDGKLLASASRDKTAKVFDAETGESLATFTGHNQPVFSVEFLPDGKQLASAGRDQKLRIWSMKESKQQRELAFSGEVFRIAVLATGDVFATSADRTVRQMNREGQPVRKLEGHADSVYSLSIHAGSKRIATGSHDGEVRLWNLETGDLINSFSAKP